VTASPPPNASAPRRIEAILLVVVLAVAFLWRASRVDHGLPFMSTFAEPRSLNLALKAARSGSVDPGYYNYPSFFFNLYGAALAAWSGLFAEAGSLNRVQVFTGGVARAGSIETVEAARRLTALFSTVSVGLVWWLARAVTQSRGAAWIALLIAAVAPSSLAFADWMNPNALAGTLVLLAMVFSTRLYEDGRTRWYVLAGIAVGLAAGAKYNAALVGIVPLALHLAREGREGWRNRRWLIVPAAALATLLAAMPALLLNTRAVLRSIQREAAHYGSGHAGWEDPWLYFTWPWTHQPLAAALAVVGVVVAIRRRDRLLLGLGSFALLYLVFIHRYPVRNLRTLSLATPLLFVFAAVGIDTLWRAGTERFGRGAVAFGVAAILSVSLLVVPFTRSVAKRWDRAARMALLAEAHGGLDRRLKTDTEVYIGPYTPLLKKKGRTFHKGDVHLKPPRWFKTHPEVRHVVVASEAFQRYLDNPKSHPPRTRNYKWLFKNFRTLKTWKRGDHSIVLLKRKAEPDRRRGGAKSGERRSRAEGDGPKKRGGKAGADGKKRRSGKAGADGKKKRGGKAGADGKRKRSGEAGKRKQGRRKKRGGAKSKRNREGAKRGDGGSNQ
jgi:4-amino-4-deoxy-L-arabinose transferase-like glycosyltransferase